VVCGDSGSISAGHPLGRRPDRCCHLRRSSLAIPSPKVPSVHSGAVG
jgi:hypothetical protein